MGDYYFSFYYERFLTSCYGWTDEQVGAYIRLLIYQYDKGYIPKNIKEIIRISQSAKKHWALLSKKFHEDENGNLVNRVMAGIREKRKRKSEVLSENGKKGGRGNSKQMLSFSEENFDKLESNTKMVIGFSSNDKIKEEKEFLPDTQFDLLENEIARATEFIKAGWKLDLTSEQIKHYWHLFAIDKLDGANGYRDRSRCVAHFRSWLNLKIPDDFDIKATKKSKFFAADIIKQARLNQNKL